MKLTPESREWIVSILGADEAAKRIAAVDAGEGLPERTRGPVLLGPNVLQWCIDLGLNEDLARELIRKCNAQTEDFRLDKQQQRDDERAAKAAYQREYRERMGDEGREYQREYMRKWREKRRKL